MREIFCYLDYPRFFTLALKSSTPGTADKGQFTCYVIAEGEGEGLQMITGTLDVPSLHRSVRGPTGRSVLPSNRAARVTGLYWFSKGMS